MGVIDYWTCYKVILNKNVETFQKKKKIGLIHLVWEERGGGCAKRRLQRYGGLCCAVISDSRLTLE